MLCACCFEFNKFLTLFPFSFYFSKSFLVRFLVRFLAILASTSILVCFLRWYKLYIKISFLRSEIDVISDFCGNCDGAPGLFYGGHGVFYGGPGVLPLLQSAGEAIFSLLFFLLLSPDRNLSLPMNSRQRLVLEIGVLDTWKSRELHWIAME